MGTARRRVADVKTHQLARWEGTRRSGGAVSTVGALAGAPERDFGRHPRFSRVRVRALVSSSWRGHGQKLERALDALES